MMNLIYKSIVFVSIFAAFALAATGLAAAAPGLVIFPIFFFALLAPALIFAYGTRHTVFRETVRRLRNRGIYRMADQIDEKGQYIDHVQANEADLHGLNLEGFSMRNADLEKAKLVRTSCQYTDFSKSFMAKARLSLGKFTNARFTKANLRKSRLRYGNFKRADFTEADLRNCNLKGANLSGANLEGADLKGAVFNDKTVWPFPKEEAFDRGAIAV